MGRHRKKKKKKDKMIDYEYEGPLTTVAGPLCSHTKDAILVTKNPIPVYAGTAYATVPGKPLVIDLAANYRSPIVGHEIELPAVLRSRRIAIDWPDMSTPSVFDWEWEELVKFVVSYVQNPDTPNDGLFVCCTGGHGRTGSALTILLKNMKVIPDEVDPIKWVREKYCKSAVETTSQITYIEKMLNFKTKETGSSTSFPAYQGAGSYTGAFSSAKCKATHPFSDYHSHACTRSEQGHGSIMQGEAKNHWCDCGQDWWLDDKGEIQVKSISFSPADTSKRICGWKPDLENGDLVIDAFPLKDSKQYHKCKCINTESLEHNHHHCICGGSWVTKTVSKREVKALPAPPLIDKEEEAYELKSGLLKDSGKVSSGYMCEATAPEHMNTDACYHLCAYLDEHVGRHECGFCHMEWGYDTWLT